MDVCHCSCFWLEETASPAMAGAGRGRTACVAAIPAGQPRCLWQVQRVKALAGLAVRCAQAVLAAEEVGYLVAELPEEVCPGSLGVAAEAAKAELSAALNVVEGLLASAEAVATHAEARSAAREEGRLPRSKAFRSS